MNKAPHIIYLVTKLELGGAQKVCLELFNGIPTDTISTTLISGTTGELVEKAASPNTIFLPSLTRELSLLFIYHEIKALRELIAVFKKIKSEHARVIVHTHSSKAGILGRWAAFFAGIKIRIHTVHGFSFHQNQNGIFWIITYLIELVTSLITTHFVCVSKADIKSGCQLLPAFKEKHSLIRAATSWRPFLVPASRASKVHPVAPNTFVFGTIACFKPQKNLFDLLQAFQEVNRHHSHVRLEIIGDGALRPSLTAWIVKHKLTHAITLHGWKASVGPYLKRWHTFVSSSLWEGLPCAMIEARLAKLPIVSYEIGGIPEIIQHGYNGLLYTEKDWRGLSKGMTLFVANTKLYERARAHRETLDDFKVSTMIAKHQKLYQQVTQL